MNTVFLILLLEKDPILISEIKNKIQSLSSVELGLISDESEFLNALHHIRFDLILANYSLAKQFKKPIPTLLEEKELDLPIMYLLPEPVPEKTKIDLLKSKNIGVFHYQEHIKIFNGILNAFEEKQKKNFDFHLYQEIEDKKNLYESLLQTIPDVIYRIDDNGYFSYVSDSVSRFGYMASDLIGKHYSLLFTKEDLQEVSRKTVLPKYLGKKTGLDLSPKLFDERRSAPRNTKNLEVQIKTKSTHTSAGHWVEIFSSGNYAQKNGITVEKNQENKTVWVEIASIGQYDKSQKDSFVGTVGVIRDISEKKESEKKFHQMFTRHASIMLLIDPADKGKIIDANNSALRFYGYSKPDLLVKTIFELSQGDEKEILTKLEKSLQGNVETLFLTQIMADGRKKQVELHTSPVQMRQRTYLFFVVQDISSKNEALELLEESRAYVEKFMNSTQDMIFLADIQTGKLLYGNSSALKTTGYSLEEITKMDHTELHPTEKAQAYKKLFANLSEKESVQPHEILLKTKNNDIILCEISGGTFMQKGRKIAFGIFRDIRERKLNERRLKEQHDALKKSNNELEHFAYAASHDLREPLRMVQSFLSILSAQYEDNLDETAHEYIHYAQEGAKRMDQLISDLLNFSRLSYQDPQHQEITLSTIIKHAQDNLKVLIDETGACFSVSVFPDPIMGDPSRLMRLFQNLMENAIKFCDKAHPKIEIKAEKKEDEILVQIKDNGIGIDEQFYTRIFKIFQRLHPRHTYKGTGIGLAVCQKIVEQHGGKIWVESQLGEGSVFNFTLRKTVIPN